MVVGAKDVVRISVSVVGSRVAAVDDSAEEGVCVTVNVGRVAVNENRVVAKGVLAIVVVGSVVPVGAGVVMLLVVITPHTEKEIYPSFIKQITRIYSECQYKTKYFCFTSCLFKFYEQRLL